MIDRLFRSRTFSVSLAVNSLTMFALVGLMLFTAQFLQLVAGLGPFAAALWMLPALLATVAGVALATLLVRRMPLGAVVAAGLGTAAAGLLAAARVEHRLLPAFLITCVGVLAAGVGMVATLATDAVAAGAPPERAGTVSALSEAGTELGGAAGIAVLGTVGAAVYRARPPPSAPPGRPRRGAGLGPRDARRGRRRGPAGARAPGRAVAGGGLRRVRLRPAGYEPDRRRRHGVRRRAGRRPAAAGPPRHPVPPAPPPARPPAPDRRRTAGARSGRQLRQGGRAGGRRRSGRCSGPARPVRRRPVSRMPSAPVTSQA